MVNDDGSVEAVPVKAPSPAFSLYPKDLLTDERVSTMRHASLGIYVKLLCHAWIDEGIPNDQELLRRMVGAEADEWNAAWPEVVGCFRVSDNGKRLIQDRLEKERGQQRIRAVRAAKGGKATQASRRQALGKQEPS